MRNSANWMAGLALALLSLPALAESTAEDLTKLEAETTVLKAKAKKLEVEAQIAAKQAEIRNLTTPAAAGDPTVRAVEGVGGRLYATVQLENGSALDVKVGDMLPNGMKILSISANEVIALNRYKKRVRLGTTPVVSMAQPGGSAYPGMSLMPSGPLPAPGRGAGLR